MKNFAALVVLVFAFIFVACGSDPTQPSSDGGTTPVVTIATDGGSGCTSSEMCQWPNAGWCVITNSVGVCAYIDCANGCSNGWVCDTVAQPNHCRPPDAPMPDAGTLCDHVNCGVGMTCVLTDMGQAECHMMDAGVADAGAQAPDAGVTQPDAGTPTPYCATFCPADNTCEIDATHNTIRCIPPTTTTPDAGVSTPDAGTVADAGITAPDAGTPPTLGCADVCPVGNTCVVDVANRTIVCIPPSVPDAGVSTPDAGTPIADAGTSVPDAGTIIPDAGTTTPDAGVSTPDAGVTQPDAGVQPPADGGVTTPVDGGTAPTVPQGAFGEVCLTMNRARLDVACTSNPHLALWDNPAFFSVPNENGTLTICTPIYYHGSMDTTIHCAAHDATRIPGDYPYYGANGRTARDVGYSEAWFYFPGGGRQDLLDTAKTLNGKLNVPFPI